MAPSFRIYNESINSQFEAHLSLIFQNVIVKKTFLLKVKLKKKSLRLRCIVDLTPLLVT